jgi:hypothetical protein
MKINIVAFGGVSLVVVIALVFAFVIVKPVLAQVDATSTEAVTASIETPADATTTDTVTDIETVSPAPEVTSSDAETSAPSDISPPAEPSSVAPTEAPPTGLTEVHIIGTKYVDYFTDGTTVTAYPGDPEIDAHLAEKDAPIPMHEGLTWVHTTGG